MSDLVSTLWITLGVVIGLSVLYRMLPARALAEVKPKFVPFPKYTFYVSDIDNFRNNLEQEGFKPLSASRYTRGSYFGDFVPAWVKLEVNFDEQAKTATLGSPLVVIAFDTGDLWKIATQLQRVK